MNGFWFRINGFGSGRRVSGWGHTYAPQPAPARLPTPVGFGFRISGLGFRVSGFGFRVTGFGF
jgi:hypothetical protein